MSYSPDQLIKISVNYEKLTAASLLAEAKKSEKKKLDPKAKVRNRGTVCVPAESAKDKKDHFPINDEGQARSALSRVEGLSSAPWYSGSLEGLKALVKRKVHAKYPGIGKDKKSKKSSVEVAEAMLAKYGIGGLGGGFAPPAPAARPQGDPKVRQLQTILRFTYKLTGQDGKPLAVDGFIGPNTKFALQSFKQEYNMPQATDAMVIYHILDTVSGGRKPGGYAGDAPAPAAQPQQQVAQYNPADAGYAIASVIEKLLEKYGK